MRRIVAIDTPDLLASSRALIWAWLRCSFKVNGHTAYSFIWLSASFAEGLYVVSYLND